MGHPPPRRRPPRLAPLPSLRATTEGSWFLGHTDCLRHLILPAGCAWGQSHGGRAQARLSGGRARRPGQGGSPSQVGGLGRSGPTNGPENVANARKWARPRLRRAPISYVQVRGFDPRASALGSEPETYGPGQGRRVRSGGSRHSSDSALQESAGPKTGPHWPTGAPPQADGGRRPGPEQEEKSSPGSRAR